MRRNNLLQTALLLLITAIVCSCGGECRAKLKAGKADSLMFAVGKQSNYKRVIELADSLEAIGDISALNANRWRGVAYYYQDQLRTAEFYYKKVVEGDIKNESDELNYYKSARRLASILQKKGNYEGAMRVAMDALWKLREEDRGSDSDAAILMNAIACCQLNLGRTEQANRNFEKSYNIFMQLIDAESIGRKMMFAFEGTTNTVCEYINAHLYEEALPWINRSEELIERFRIAKETPASVRDSAIVDSQSLVNLLKAIVYQHIGREKEALQAYRAAANTRFGNSGEGRIYANEYLMAAHRYNEAADNFSNLDRLLDENGISLTLDNIQQYLLPKYRANVGALRHDTAISVGMQICEALDSTIAHSKKNDAAELATIYDTQQKEAQIVRQQADLTRERFIGTAAALVLIVVFFTIYTLHRRRATHHLAVAHEKLQQAYDQLEETTAIKERIESELRIARDIQMSMVPNVFPDRDDVDLYASMTPAKEVGGDLYGYLLSQDVLYFCLGDVSGKGVPASLFMAQATRLFRTLAAQGMMPAEIATRMNAALSGEDNERGMFVTMFIGRIDLVSGRLDFCNAGHNPPILRDGSNISFIQVEANAPIGLWPGLDFEGEHMENMQGKSIFIYSDGLNEAENKQQSQFGDDRLLEMLRTTKFENSRQVIVMLNAEVEKHRNGADPNDDLTMMCLRLKKKD